MNKMVTIFFALLLLVTSSTYAQQIEKIYVFGDSLSDTGNLYSLIKHKIPVSPPYFNGHFSNGLMWPEYLVVDLGLPVASLENFSFGGAKTKSNGRMPPPGLDSQLATYFSGHQSATPNSLYILWIGANNYLRAEKPGDNDVDSTVNDIMQSVWQLVNHGAKNILVMNVPDVGTIPYAQQADVVNKNKNYSTNLTNATRAHNIKLAEKMDEVITQLSMNNPDVKLMLFDVNTIMASLFSDPDSFNLQNLKDPCYQGDYYRYNDRNICENRDNYLFWDKFHPTTAVHEAIAQVLNFTLVHNGYHGLSPLYKHYPAPDDVAINTFKLYDVEK